MNQIFTYILSHNLQLQYRPPQSDSFLLKIFMFSRYLKDV